MSIRIPGDRAPVINLTGEAIGLASLIKDMGYFITTEESDNSAALHFSTQMTALDITIAVHSCPYPLIRVGHWPDGFRSALCVSGDIDCLTLQDFMWRFVERT